MKMEKINLVELLKDCPSGMELNCTMYDNLYFDKVVEEYKYPIGCYTIYDGCRTSVNFTEFGEFNNCGTAKCVIFPKGKTTWEGFHRPFKVKDHGYKWNAETKTLEKLFEPKFKIGDLKPFDKVLIRDNGAQMWSISFFSHCNGLEAFKFSCINGNLGFEQCIPYEGNEHLLGTYDDCDEYFKNWK